MAKTLSDKFFLKSCQRVAVINAPQNYLTETLQPPADVTIAHELDGQFDQIHYFLSTRAQVLEVIDDIKAHLKEGGIIWLSYPKGGAKARIPTDMNRDSLYALVRDHGLEANHQISIDDTWSALRFKVI